MEIWLWLVIGVLAVVIFALLIKIYLLRKAAGEIETAFADRLSTETNTLIGISSQDKAMRALADSINAQLRLLREERRRFVLGDTELKNAVANISHDLRTPLTAICGYLDLLELEEKPEIVEQYLGVIRNRADMLTQLTEELFEYSVILSGGKDKSKEGVILNRALEESLAAFYTALKARGIEPEVQMCEGQVVRTLDRSALLRVFSNLLSNTVKYSGGDLEIALRETGEIVFSNSAPGLNEVQVGRLFDRFYTVEAARKSTGLGLAIARTLTERMGGTIAARYENGRLTIRVFFPDKALEEG